MTRRPRCTAPTTRLLSGLQRLFTHLVEELQTDGRGRRLSRFMTSEGCCYGLDAILRLHMAQEEELYVFFFKKKNFFKKKKN